MKAAAGGDAETACGLVIDPTTDEPMTGTNRDACVQGFEQTAEADDAEFDPELADMLDRSMIETTDNGDGTIAVSMLGEDTGQRMTEGSDGEWYVVADGLL